MQPGMQCLLANVWARVTWTEKWVGQAPLYVQRQSSGSSVVRQPLVLSWNPIRCSIETKYFGTPRTLSFTYFSMVNVFRNREAPSQCQTLGPGWSREMGEGGNCDPDSFTTCIRGDTTNMHMVLQWRTNSDKSVEWSEDFRNSRNGR